MATASRPASTGSASWGMRNSLLTVISPLDGTPASRLGIRAGDII
jgi:C-terminal processing protease CtpA/Prc